MTFYNLSKHRLRGLFFRKRPKIPFAAGENASVILSRNRTMLPLKLKFPMALNQIRSEYRSLNGYFKTDISLLIDMARYAASFALAGMIGFHHPIKNLPMSLLAQKFGED